MSTSLKKRQECSQETIWFPSEKSVSSHERGSIRTSWWCASSKACWMVTKESNWHLFCDEVKEVWDNKRERSPYNVLYDADGERPMRQRRIIPRKGGNPSYGSSRCIINLGQLLPSPTSRIKFVPSAPIGLTLLHKGLASNINPFLHIYAD